MVSGQSRKTNHVLHLLLTIFTCGLWAIVWLIIAINNQDPSNVPARMTIVVDDAGHITYNQ